MQPTEIKAHIQTKQFRSFYIFAGPEWKVQRTFIDMISKVAGKELNYIEGIMDVYSKLNNRSFIQKSYVYVVRDDKEILQNEKLQSQLSSILGDNILILLLTTVDKRLKFYKTFKEDICEFEALKPDILRKYIQKEIDLSDKNADKLAEVCEQDYGRCLLEIDKIKQYVAGAFNLSEAAQKFDKSRWNIAFEELLNSGIIYQPPKDAIFDFIDAILDSKVDLVFDLYEQCLAVGEASMVMITVLYNNAKAVLQVQSCESNDVSKSTGLTSFQVMNAKKHVGVFSNGELLHIMNLCQEGQQGIVTGTIEEEFVMDYILTGIF